jgi:hypothetical protein
VDERGGLESRCGLRVTVGSNPTPSAKGDRGTHLLVPSVVDLLRRRRKVQAEQRLLSSEPWPEHNQVLTLLPQ